MINLHDSQIDKALSVPAVAGLIRQIIKVEGGLANDPADPGGITNDGISLRYAKGVGLDLDGDGDVDGEDIILVTPEIAARCMVDDFFIIPRINKLPDCLWPFLVDFAVSSGPGTAISRLQKLLNAIRVKASVNQTNGWPILLPDGVSGKQTLAASERALASVGFPQLSEAMCDQREAYLRQLVKDQPHRQPDLNGWLNRVATFRGLVKPDASNTVTSAAKSDARAKT